MPSFENLGLNLIYVLLGLITHIVKRSAVEKINPIEYVIVHKGRAGTAFGLIITAFATLYATRPEASPMEFFAVGYLGDSILNKQPTKEEVEQRHMNVQKAKAGE